MDGRTDGRIDKQIPPVFYRTSSPSGPLPKKKERKKEERDMYSDKRLEKVWGGGRILKRERKRWTTRGERSATRNSCPSKYHLLKPFERAIFHTSVGWPYDPSRALACQDSIS